MKLSLFSLFKKMLPYFLVNNFNQQLISANDKTLEEVFHSQCGHLFSYEFITYQIFKVFSINFS
jgi:hypothetical protein